MIVAGLCSLLMLRPAGVRLFLVGGGSTPPEIPGRFIAECGGPYARIVVLPLTREEPEVTGPASEELLREAGARNTVLFAKKTVSEADRALLLSYLKGARGVWVPGGDQTLLVSRLGKAWIDRYFVPMLRHGMLYFGTSAGAMLASSPMINGPGKVDGTVEIGDGIGLTTWLIDTHYRQRNRQARLNDAIRQTHASRALGLSEKEWVVIENDTVVEKHGDITVISPSR
jgi:cyanophycinase